MKRTPATLNDRISFNVGRFLRWFVPSPWPIACLDLDICCSYCLGGIAPIFTAYCSADGPRQIGHVAKKRKKKKKKKESERGEGKPEVIIALDIPVCI